MKEWFVENVWWNITSTLYWWKVNLSKPEPAILHPEEDLFVSYSSNGKWIYYQEYNLNGRIYKVRRTAW